MGIIYVGSARQDERGKLSGGKAGDQKQKLTNGLDLSGEVSMQPMYKHSKGFYIIRPKNGTKAEEMAYLMIQICNDAKVGYDQGNRGGIFKDSGLTETDCSSLIRFIVKSRYGVDPGNFTTANERKVLLGFKINGSNVFMDCGKYVSQERTPVYNGDILVTCTKGHTVMVCGGSPRQVVKSTVNKEKVEYYPAYTGTRTSIVDALGASGEKNTSLANRKRIAIRNGLKPAGTTEGNNQMLALLKAGKLKKL